MDKYLTVTALNKYIKYLFDGDENLAYVLLKGEISNFKRHFKGHCYFTIKDENAQISAVMFQNQATKLTFEPKEGTKVLICGRVCSYEKTGNYQIYVNEMIEDGLGVLYQKYLKLKNEFESLGYFDEDKKKPLPKFPKKIGVITSKTGAVIKDIINTVNKRYPLAKIILFPSLVQGEMAKDNLVEKIHQAQQTDIDVLIIGRGGGSIEDLWAFNERIVAMAIKDCPIPVISAVGHETDFTICDFISDIRAATPTAAAMIATPDFSELFRVIKLKEERVNGLFENYLFNIEQKLVNIDRVLLNISPIKRVNDCQKRYLEIKDHLNRNINIILENKYNDFFNINKRIKRIDLNNIIMRKQEMLTRYIFDLKNNIMRINNEKKQKLDIEITKLKNLNPLLIMEKGYSIVSHKGKPIKKTMDLKKDDILDIRLHKGSLKAKVLEVE